MNQVLTEEQQHVIDQGVAAGKLLRDPTFISVTNELAAACLNGIVNSEPKENRKREDFYFTHVALQSIHGILRARVAAALKVQADVDEDSVEDEMNPAAPLMADGI